MKNLTLAFVLILAACAGEAEPETALVDAAPEATTVAVQDDPPETQTPADEPADVPEPASNATAIVLNIGDDTWEFPSAQCAFYNAPAGDAGSEWNVSNIKDGLQVYIVEDSFGTSVSVADIENGGNPTVSWEAVDSDVEITVNGDEVSASGTFTDAVNGGAAEGTLTATCPGWLNAG